MVLNFRNLKMGFGGAAAQLFFFDYGWLLRSLFICNFWHCPKSHQKV
jgi:hypothetical protein